MYDIVEAISPTIFQVRFNVMEDLAIEEYLVFSGRSVRGLRRRRAGRRSGSQVFSIIVLCAPGHC